VCDSVRAVSIVAVEGSWAWLRERWVKCEQSDRTSERIRKTK
jgi:hypothetical protein